MFSHFSIFEKTLKSFERSLQEPQEKSEKTLQEIWKNFEGTERTFIEL